MSPARHRLRTAATTAVLAVAALVPAAATAAPATQVRDGAVCLAPAPEPPAPRATRAPQLSEAQLRINQKIYAAALRRADAIERWLDAGLVAGDLCGGAVTADLLGPGIVTGTGATAGAPAPPSPRPIVVPPASSRPGGRIVLSARQLRVNQRIAAAAVRRANALAARLEAGLTGADLRAGAVSGDRLAAGLVIVSATAPATPPATSAAPPARTAAKPGAAVRLSAAQLRTNQRIGQAAIRRLNTIVRHLESGIGPRDLRRGTITVPAVGAVAAPPAPAPKPGPAPGTDASGLVADDFNRPNLDRATWAFSDPLGTGDVRIEGAGAGDARIRLTAPAGAPHDATDNRTVRVTQPIADTDFVYEVKFASAVTQRFQIQGIQVEEGPGRWIRFEVYHDGSGTRAYAGTISGGSLVTRADVSVASGAPGWLRVSRQGDTWTQEYSRDGGTWTQTARFTYAISATRAGIHASNQNASTAGTAPAHTAIADYMQSVQAPIAGEDAGPATDTLAPFVHRVRTSATASSVTLTWATDESASRAVRYGRTAALELGQVAGGGTGTSHSVTVGGLDPATAYVFRAVSADSGARTGTSADVVVTTDGVAQPPVIDLWYGDSQVVGSPGVAQDFVNVLGNVSDPDGVSGLTYALNGGAQQALSRGPDDRRLARQGDFNAEIPVASLSAGANQVVIRATDGTGAVATRTVTVTYSAGLSWPLPSLVDWGAASSLQQVSQVVDGKWQLTAGGARTVEVDYDRLIAVGDRGWDDYEATVPVTVHSVDHAGGNNFFSNGAAIGLFNRWQGHTAEGAEQPRAGFFPAGAYVAYRWRPGGPERYELQAEGEPRRTSAAAFEVGVPYLFKYRVTTQPSGHGLYQFKAWRASDPEPGAWAMQVEGVSDLPTGSLLLIAHHVDATFGDVTITPL
ncbi:MAG: hypothetical protein AB7V62_00660 [Thermoleophilia bacterium]